MRIGIVSRFPLAESTRWKQDLIDGLIAEGHSVFVVFGKKSVLDHAKEAARRAASHKGSRDIRHIAPAKIGKLMGKLPGARKADAVSPSAAPKQSSDNERSGNERSGNERSGNAPSEKSQRLAAFAKQRNCVVGAFASVNSSEAIAFVNDQKPDLLILAGAEIVRPPLLAVAPLGTLNPHYGPLPHFRGMSAQEWCLYQKVPPAVTIHFVSSGIDTGDIISVTPLPLAKTDSWSDVRRHCQNVACEGLLDAVRSIATESVVTTPQRNEDGRQYFAMHPRLLLRAKRNLESGYWNASGSDTATRNDISLTTQRGAPAASGTTP